MPKHGHGKHKHRRKCGPFHSELRTFMNVLSFKENDRFPKIRGRFRQLSKIDDSEVRGGRRRLESFGFGF